MNTPLDLYEKMPEAMWNYLTNYGWNFSKKAFECAVKAMYKKNPNTGKKERIDRKSKEEVEEILKKHNIVLEHDAGYNAAYVYHMGLADYFKSSITDEQHLAMYVKDVIDDDDNEGGNVFRKWYVDCVAKGIPVMWDDIL